MRRWIASGLRRPAWLFVLAVGMGGPWVICPGVAGASSAVGVGAGQDHACALLAGGGVDCWGGSEGGPLGNRNGLPPPPPVAVSGLDNAIGVSAGRFYTCVIVSDRGKVKCWGDAVGQL